MEVPLGSTTSMGVNNMHLANGTNALAGAYKIDMPNTAGGLSYQYGSKLVGGYIPQSTSMDNDSPIIISYKSPPKKKSSKKKTKKSKRKIPIFEGGKKYKKNKKTQKRKQKK